MGVRGGGGGGGGLFSLSNHICLNVPGWSKSGSSVILSPAALKWLQSFVPSLDRNPLDSEFCRNNKLESLSKDVFERRTSTGSEVFPLTICLDGKKFVLISFFSLIRTIYLRVSTKPPPSDAKRPLPVDVRRSKTLLLKLPIIKSPKRQKSQPVMKKNPISTDIVRSI